MGIYGLRAHLAHTWNQYLVLAKPHEYIVNGCARLLAPPAVMLDLQDLELQAKELTWALTDYTDPVLPLLNPAE